MPRKNKLTVHDHIKKQEKQFKEEPLKKKTTKHHVKVSHKFISVLSIVSIVGFIGIVSQTLFDFDISFFVEALWLIVIGLGLIFEARLKTLKEVRERGLNSHNFTHLITLIIGAIAIISGIFSFPGIRVLAPAFVAVKGIVALIAIVIIAIQTWVVE